MNHQQKDSRTIRHLVESHVTALDDIEDIYHRECRGTLSELEEQWHRYESVEELPELPLDGWEELVVYTDDQVLRWVETGFQSGPTRTPRSPRALGASRRESAAQ
jgi:hypothetical protein